MKNESGLDPRKAIFWIYIYSVAAPLCGFAFMLLSMPDVYFYIPRLFYGYTFIPVLILSETMSAPICVLFGAFLVMVYALAALNCFLCLKKQKTFLVIPTMAVISLDLVITALVVLSSRDFGPLVSFVIDVCYLVFLFQFKKEIRDEKK